MERSTQLGRNRTGIDMSPIDSKKMISAAENCPPSPSNGTNGFSLKTMEQHFIQEAETVGSVPLPGTVKGALKSVMQKAAGHNPEMFINKLGERLAYERSGVRIYESLIRKCEIAPDEKSSVSVPLAELHEFRDQEAEHFALLKECIESIGADPTAQTPDADISALASSGLMKVIMDPRTSLTQCLETMLSIELTDNAAWGLLIKLANDLGLDEIQQRFEHCLQQEDMHVKQIREWYEQAVRQQAVNPLH